MKIADYLKDIAFVMIPVADPKASRQFYEGTLGLKVTANWEDKWIEFDIGHGTLAITKADETHKPGVHGPTVALEVIDLNRLVQALKDSGVAMSGEPWDSPACRGCIIHDPDGNEIILHVRK